MIERIIEYSIRNRFIVLILAVLLGVGRAILPRVVRNYVNRTLDRNPL